MTRVNLTTNTRGGVMKKNCHNCINGYWDNESDGEYFRGDYFVCEGRGDQTIDFEINLTRTEYLEKAKRCCVLKAAKTHKE